MNGFVKNKKDRIIVTAFLHVVTAKEREKKKRDNLYTDYLVFNTGYTMLLMQLQRLQQILLWVGFFFVCVFVFFAMDEKQTWSLRAGVKETEEV